MRLPSRNGSAASSPVKTAPKLLTIKWRAPASTSGAASSQTSAGLPAYIICTQPRRISAMTVAERIANERGEKLQPVARLGGQPVQLTTNPGDEWAAQQVINAFPNEEAPRFLIRDRDGIYGDYFTKRVESMGIEEVPTAPRSPWQNPYCERVTRLDTSGMPRSRDRTE